MIYSRHNIDGVQFKYNNDPTVYTIVIAEDRVVLYVNNRKQGATYSIDHAVNNLNDPEVLWHPITINENVYDIF